MIELTDFWNPGYFNITCDICKPILKITSRIFRVVKNNFEIDLLIFKSKFSLREYKYIVEPLTNEWAKCQYPTGSVCCKCTTSPIIPSSISSRTFWISGRFLKNKFKIFKLIYQIMQRIFKFINLYLTITRILVIMWCKNF